jgi:NAD(P)-dependent dehydrogenase (short-subunit alcohol dehydrogenase family)
MRRTLANSRSIPESGFSSSAERVTRPAISRFGSINHVVNNASIYEARPLTEHSVNDLYGFVSTNLEGFVFSGSICEPPADTDLVRQVCSYPFY